MAQRRTVGSDPVYVPCRPVVCTRGIPEEHRCSADFASSQGGEPIEFMLQPFAARPAQSSLEYAEPAPEGTVAER
jgi:hypothetical protein